MDLALPQRKKPGPHHRKSDPDYVRAWADSLPLLNTDKTYRLLVETLDELNTLDILPRTRGRILEHLSTSVICITDALKKDFFDQPMPLSEQGTQAADSALELCNRMATGYRIMADDLGRNETQNQPLAIALHRSIRYLSEVLLGHYQIYRVCPDGLWRSIHSLYALAEESEISNIAVTDTTSPTREASNIETIYKQVLMLALACPYRLRQNEIHFAYNALIDWASYCRLDAPGTRKVIGLFCVDLLSDNPPSYHELRPQGESKVHHLRILDTTAVADRLRAVLENESRNQTGFGNRDTLQQLILAWGAMPRRRFPRHAPATLPVRLIIGLNNIHALIEEPDESLPDVEEIIMDHALLQDPTFDRSTKVEVDPYNTGDLTGQQARPDEDSPLQGALAGFEPRTGEVEFWRIADMSAGGYCLLWENSTPSSARVGELAAILVQDDSAPDAWQLGVIRWMKFTPDIGLEVGIQLLSPGARAVWAYVRNDDLGHRVAAINRMQGILLPAIDTLDQAAALILPCLPFRTGCSSILELQDGTEEIVLTRQLENTGRFAQYHFALQAAEAD